MSSQTSTCIDRPGTSYAVNTRSGPNGTVSPPMLHPLARHVVARREPAALVELPVVGQVRLRRHAQHLAAVDDDRAVVDARAPRDRRAHDQHGHQVGARRDDLRDRVLHAGEQRVLEEEVVDGVARQAELGEHRHRDVVVVAGPRLRDDLGGVGGGIGQVHGQRARGDAREALRVGGVEVHALTLGNSSPAGGRVTTVAEPRLPKSLDSRTVRQGAPMALEITRCDDRRRLRGLAPRADRGHPLRADPVARRAARGRHPRAAAAARPRRRRRRRATASPSASDSAGSRRR